jgi:hypothetical protein
MMTDHPDSVDDPQRMSITAHDLGLFVQDIGSAAA